MQGTTYKTPAKIHNLGLMVTGVVVLTGTSLPGRQSHPLSIHRVSVVQVDITRSSRDWQSSRSRHESVKTKMAPTAAKESTKSTVVKSETSSSSAFRSGWTYMLLCERISMQLSRTPLRKHTGRWGVWRGAGRLLDRCGLITAKRCLQYI